MTKNTGSRYERELVNLLSDMKFAVIRVPSSGSSTDRELPDLLAGNKESSLSEFRGVYAFEAKYNSGDYIYVEGGKVEGLKWVADRFGGVPKIASRWSQDTNWYLSDPSDCHKTDSGNLRIKRSNRREYPTLEEVVEI